MFLPRFDYHAASSFDDALDRLAVGDDAKLLAGGMSLIPMMKLRVASPSLIIDLGRIPALDGITADGVLRIQALARHRAVAADSEVRRHATALAEAAAMTGDPQVRNRGTTCGSIAHADAASDQAAALLALGGMIVAHSVRGVRHIPAASFFVDMFTTCLEPDEAVAEVTVPPAGPGEGSAYLKVGRKGTSEGFAIAGAGAWVRVEHGTIVAARVALAGVSTKPVLSAAMMTALVGSPASLPAVAAAAEVATEGIPILADLHGSERYKARLAAVIASRAAQRALERAVRMAI